MNPHLIELESSPHKPFSTKVLVIGAGPAGISFGNCLSKSTKDFLIVDMGSDLLIRDRDDPFDCVAGAGGAGLFSDGKFSFFPSGTAIWTLPHQNILSESYKELQDLFKDSIETEIPEFPSEGDISRMTSNSSYELKKYPCFYISLEKRKQLISYMTKEIPKILYNHKMVDWEKTDDGKYKVQLEDTRTLQKREVECEQLVLAGGRFFPLFLNEKKVAKTFKRYEYGVRLVGRNEQFHKVKQEEILDPKWMYRPSPELEFRTFCMCKDGEYVCSNFMGIQSYSGRADVPATGYTNFGLTSRIKTNNNEDFERILKCGPFEESLMTVIQNPQMLEVIFGEELGKIYMKGLLKFIENFELKPEELKIIGPSIEGVGEYPKINENLQVEGENIFVIGDSSGIFRGIVPSMISGFYAANFLKDRF